MIEKRAAFCVVMPRLDPPAGPKALRRGEAPGIHPWSKTTDCRIV